MIKSVDSPNIIELTTSVVCQPMPSIKLCINVKVRKVSQELFQPPRTLSPPFQQAPGASRQDVLILVIGPRGLEVQCWKSMLTGRQLQPLIAFGVPLGGWHNQPADVIEQVTRLLLLKGFEGEHDEPRATQFREARMAERSITAVRDLDFLPVSSIVGLEEHLLNQTKGLGGRS